jgi:sulfonate transport system permease protein
VTLIALGVFFPVYLNLADCIRSVDRKLIEVGRAYGLGRLAIARRIVLPATMPGLITGLRGGMGLGWMFVVAAELIAASQGLGFLLSEGRVMARPDIVVGAIILFAILGKISDVAIKVVQKRALHWQDVAKR